MSVAAWIATVRRDTPWGTFRITPTAVLVVLSVALILLLTVSRVTGGPHTLELLGQLALVIAFGTLAVIDLRAAVAISIVELALAGASGEWTEFPGGVHGRIVLYGIVIVRAASTILLESVHERRFRLGRYGLHALVLAIALPGIWMTLGVLNGNDPRSVFADGDGLLFLAFVLPVWLLIRDGYGPWLRWWLLITCAINAVLTGFIVAISAPGLVAAEPTLRQILADQLMVGNAIGYMPNGAYRLYLASGVYLQVGLALTASVLLHQPRRLWLWGLYTLLIIDVLATYTRGFWIGSALAVSAVIILASSSLRRSLMIAAGSVAIMLALGVVGYGFRISLFDYVLDRAATTLDTGSGTPPASDIFGGAPQPSAVPGVDTAGILSNQIRVVQADILVGHIRERPIAGYGFGSVAPDYPYGHSFSYELAYLDLWYKTGILGLVLFLSFPIRLILDALRARIGRGSLGEGVSLSEVAVVVAIVGSLLLVGASNPYILAAFGLSPIILSIAWLDDGSRAQIRLAAPVG